MLTRAQIQRLAQRHGIGMQVQEMAATGTWSIWTSTGGMTSSH